MAVHIAARIQAAVHSSEILVSSTVKDLTVGSTVRFADRGVAWASAGMGLSSVWAGPRPHDAIRGDLLLQTLQGKLA